MSRQSDGGITTSVFDTLFRGIEVDTLSAATNTVEGRGYVHNRRIAVFGATRGFTTGC